MGAPFSDDTLVAARRALSDAIRPRITRDPPTATKLWPVRNVPKLRGKVVLEAVPGKAGKNPVAPSLVAKPAAPDAQTAPAPLYSVTQPLHMRDDSRAIGIDMDPINGATFALPPMARFTHAQQQSVADAAAALLADAAPIAQKVAPGMPVHVALRGRIVASTDPSKIVAVRPGGQIVAPSNAKPAPDPAPAPPGRRGPPVAAPAAP